MPRDRFAGCWRKEGVQFGRCCVDRTRVPVMEIVERVIAGESIDVIAADFLIEPWQVEDALRLALAAARGLTGERHEQRMAELLREHGREAT